MGSFQQILMGATCLAAAFFFGSYLHNRPTENTQIGQEAAAPADPVESLLAFGQRPANSVPSSDRGEPTSVAAQFPTTTASRVSAIDPSELAPAIRQNEESSSSVQQTNRDSGNVPAVRKPVVPDFSELASRFRNTPLELAKPASNDSSRDAVHESERVEYSGTFRAPEMVIREPKNVVNLDEAADQVEQSIMDEFVRNEAQPSRWRVNRPESVDKFPVATKPSRKPIAEPRETIDDVVSRQSADWLKADSSQQQTFATNPPQTEGWMSNQRQRVTAKAAERNRDILDIEDPGNRFRSVLNDVEEVAPPQPDLGDEYYTPTQQRQDSIPPRQISTRMRSIQSGAASQNWSRQSNVRDQYGNRYEIQPGDTLQSISVRFFGTADRYLEIYKANREVLDRITSSPAGVVIEIPNLNN